MIDGLYGDRGDNFVRGFNDIFRNRTGLYSMFIVDFRQREVDVIIELNSRKIALEGKRIDAKRNVSAAEAEEVIANGSRHKPSQMSQLNNQIFQTRLKRILTNLM